MKYKKSFLPDRKKQDLDLTNGISRTHVFLLLSERQMPVGNATATGQKKTSKVRLQVGTAQPRRSASGAATILEVPMNFSI